MLDRRFRPGAPSSRCALPMLAMLVASLGLCSLPAVAVASSLPASAGTGVSVGGAPTVPSDASALGGYDVLIADRGNNRILLVAPNKQILWEYDFPGMRAGTAADDAFFADGGKSIIASLEHQQVIEVIDRASKAVAWSYGTLGQPGAGPGHLDYPDDAYRLPHGHSVVADIRNCRILEIAPDHSIARQAGVSRQCGASSSLLNVPNGDTPLPGGRLLVSTIQDHSMVELDAQWRPMLRLTLPIRYPSDPQPMANGHFLIAAYTHPGSIIEVDQFGHVDWRYDGSGEGELNRPSLARELPNGNILANDDLNHRVIVIDKASKRIVWQYGVTHQPGTATGYLSIPDGLDIEKDSQWQAPASSSP